MQIKKKKKSHYLAGFHNLPFHTLSFKNNLPPSLQETHFITVDDLEEAVKELIDAWMNAIFFNSLFAKSSRKATVKSVLLMLIYYSVILSASDSNRNSGICHTTKSSRKI